MVNKKKDKKMKMFEQIVFTKHFIERYCQRILHLKSKMSYKEVRDVVLDDMIERMTIIEKQCFELLTHSGIVKLTLGHTAQIVIEDNRLITVY